MANGKLKNMERIKWVDVAKGWGIILVIYGHIANDFISTWLYTFHVPLFFFLSGYFFNPKKAPALFFQSKARGLLLPYLTLGIPLFIINVCYGMKPLELLQIYAIQCRASTLWFIAALFMQFVLAYLIYHWIASSKVRWLFVAVFTIIGITLWHQGVLHLPWNMDVSMVTLPFFCLGHELRGKPFFNHLFSSQNATIWLCVFLTVNIIGTIIMCHIPFPTVDLYSSQFSLEPIAYITAIAGILFICLIANKWYSKYIAYIGQNSLVFFVWQQDIAIMLVNKIINHLHVLEAPSGLMLFAKNIIILLASLTILTILNELIIKTKLRVLIGKR